MAETKEKKPVLQKFADRSLKCDLTREEIEAAGQALADALQNVSNLEAELKSFKENIGSKIAEAEAIASRNGALVRQKYDYRQVRCEIETDYNTERVTVTRTDLMKIIDERRMTKDELSELPLDDK